jgi:hypothetical protein
MKGGSKMRKRYLLFNPNGVFSGTDDVLLGFRTEAGRQTFIANVEGIYGAGVCAVVAQADVRSRYDLSNCVEECGHYVFMKR